MGELLAALVWVVGAYFVGVWHGRRALDRYDGATFRHLDIAREEQVEVVLPRSRWERMGRPLSIEVGIEGPGQGWFTELNGHDEPRRCGRYRCRRW